MFCVRDELIETSPTSHRNLFFRVANFEIQLRAQNSLSGSAARLFPLAPGASFFGLPLGVCVAIAGTKRRGAGVDCAVANLERSAPVFFFFDGAGSP